MFAVNRDRESEFEEAEVGNVPCVGFLYSPSEVALGKSALNFMRLCATDALL